MITATSQRPTHIEKFPSNKELAKASGLSEPSISLIFAGKRRVTLGAGGSAEKLMKALEIDSLDLLVEVIELKRTA